MDIVWLRSPLRDASSALPCVPNLQVFDESEDLALALTSDSNLTTLIIEVLHPNDADRAFELLEEFQSLSAVWIFEPEATVASTMAFLKAGACHVAMTATEIEHAAASLPYAGAAPVQPSTSLVGVSRSILAIGKNIGLIADKKCNVLIEGETGTGKEVVAREIHGAGARRRGPWVAVNCGAIPETLLEAELFGHVKGAYTGAFQSRAGKFEAANHGTIFLDEIGEMPLSIQAKLLRVLQEKEIERLGGNERIRLDIRVIAATNVNLLERVKEGLFRQDLYYRLNVFRIAIEPLRDRLMDIPVLARHFMAKICGNENIRTKTLDTSALDQLCTHSWPGNARELENVLETAIIVSGARSIIYASDIRMSRNSTSDTRSRAAGASANSEGASEFRLPAEGLDYQQALHAFEHHLLTQAITRTRGNKTAAADLLHLKRTTLSARMRVLESRLPRLVA
jgi:transcriptional regulator with PAS, ATPase and Fis domain